VKKEKLRNPMTGQYEDPDQRLMNEVETLLGSPDKPEDVRHGLINTIAAWAIDHPDQPVDHQKVFKAQLRRLREAVFAERRSAVAKLCRDVLLLLKEDGAGLDAARRAAAERAVEQLKLRFGYENSSASDAAVALVRERLASLLS
jgi:predicted Ser/Thr protein kinase